MSVNQVEQTSFAHSALHARPPAADSFHEHDFLYNPITEVVDYENIYLFETRLSDLEKLVPAGTKCLRISEEKGLFGMGMQNFIAGQFKESPQLIQKIYAIIVVEPDYEVKMATPRFCFYTIRACTTDVGLNDHTFDVNKAPIYRTSGLKIEIDHEQCTTRVSDDDGPMFELDTPFKHRNYTELDNWGQVATMQDGKLYWQAWHWEGCALEFFLNKKIGKFHEHPFLAGINVNDLTCRHIFAAKPGYHSRMNLYKPILKADVSEDEEKSMREESQAFSDQLEEHVYGAATTTHRSEYFRDLSRYLAGGIHYNFHGFPLKFLSRLITRGQGSRVWDEDGREYLDLYGKFGAMFLGHGHEEYNERLKSCIDQVTVVDSSGLELEAARRLQQHVPSADLVRFSLSGTEAVQNAIRLARAYTGKNRIIRFYGHYHGNADNIMGGKARNVERPCPEDYIADVFYTEGRAEEAFRDQMYITQWNETSMLEMLLEERQSEIAALLMEPICINGGGIEPEEGYLEEVAALCKQYGVLLIFDEVITGVRCGLGGAQSLLGVTPDISVYGKALAGGAVPVSAVMGRQDIMDLYTTTRTVHGGTFNGYPLGMAAVSATLEILEREGDYFTSVSQKADRILAGFKAAAAEYDVPLSVQGPSTGITFHVNEHPLDSSLQFTKDQLKQNLLLNIIALEHGILFSPISRMYSNLQLTDEDVTFFEERIGDVMKTYSDVCEAVTV